MINVLSLVPYNFLPPKMGGQKGIAFFYQFFCKKVNLTCVTTKSNNINGITDYTILKKLSNNKSRYINPLYFFLLKRIIQQKKITHVIIEHPYYGWLGILLKYFCGVKLVTHSHNIEALRFKSIGKWWWRILWQYEKMTHRFSDYNFFIHEDDKKYSITTFGLTPSKCIVVTYGFELLSPPAKEERIAAKEALSSQYNIAKGECIMLFNGTLNYKPNKDALDIILESINPQLLAVTDFKYKIIICGSKLAESYKELTGYAEKNIIYAGFVEDITLFFKGADIFINPVMDGGGIKTKLVEALGYNMNVVTTRSGAIGVPETISGLKMKIIEDGNWSDFSEAILKTDLITDIPGSFFKHFYWGEIADKAATFLQSE